MRRSLAMAVVAVLSAATLSSCSSSDTSPTETATPASLPAAFTDRNASGEALANGWFELLSSTGTGTGTSVSSPEQLAADAARMQPFLDPAFQLQRASGQRFTRQNYAPVDVDEFEITDVIDTRPRDDVRVVRYAARVPGATAPDEGMVLSDQLGPRLTVLRWDETLGQWTIVSHANYNVPTAAICDREPITVSDEQVAEDPAVRSLGEELVREWRDITTGKSKESVMSPESQIQLADGQGWPNPDGTPIEWTPAKAYAFKNLVTTRNQDLLVASYDAVASDLAIEGEAYRNTAAPRLLTYLRNADDEWKLIALANFTVPKGVPAGVDCADPEAGASPPASIPAG